MGIFILNNEIKRLKKRLVIFSIGAFIIGICENLIKATSYSVFSDAFTFAVLVVVLIFRPTGIFGEKTVDKV